MIMTRVVCGYVQTGKKSGVASCAPRWSSRWGCVLFRLPYREQVYYCSSRQQPQDYDVIPLWLDSKTKWYCSNLFPTLLWLLKTWRCALGNSARIFLRIPLVSSARDFSSLVSYLKCLIFWFHCDYSSAWIYLK